MTERNITHDSREFKDLRRSIIQAIRCVEMPFPKSVVFKQLLRLRL